MLKVFYDTVIVTKYKTSHCNKSAVAFLLKEAKLMPRKPKRPCSYPSCPNLVDGQYCEEHKKLTDKHYNQYRRDTFTKSFYNTPKWKAARKRQLLQEPLCAECLKAGRPIKAKIADHIVPIKQGGDKFAPSNLQSLCWSCHSRKSAKEGSRWGK